jgi:uncharacterized protein (DUF58 family)
VLLNLDHRVGIALFSTGVDRFLPPARGRAAYIALRRLLAPARPRSAGGASNLEACIDVLGPHRQAAVISDFLTRNAMTDELGSLVARCGGVHAFRVVGRSGPGREQGPLTVRDAETGDRLAVAVDPGLDDRLARRQEALGMTLERYCRRHGVRLSANPADKPWDQVLLEHLLGPGARLA